MLLNFKKIEQNYSVNDIKGLIVEKGKNLTSADLTWLQYRVDKLRADHKIFVDKLFDSKIFNLAYIKQNKREVVVLDELFSDMVKIRDYFTNEATAKKNVNKRWNKKGE